MSYATESNVCNLLNTIKNPVIFVKDKICINYITVDDIKNNKFHIRSSIYNRPIEMTDNFWGRDGYIIDNDIPYAFLERNDVVIVGVIRC
jgi:hypothetical protein